LGEFLIADSGYADRGYLCDPYRQPYASLDHNKVFNELFSSRRVVIEHINGILKNRFSPLRELSTQIIKKEGDFKQVDDWILVCLILHNILLSFSDESVDDIIEAEEPVEDDGCT
jgi:hypothetical protein